MKTPHLGSAAIAAVLVAFLLSGCAMFQRKSALPPPAAVAFTPTPVTELPPLDPSLLQRPATPYRVGPGDQLEIEVLGDLDTRTVTTVGPDGKLYFYMLPGIDVWGLTVGQVRERIQSGLQQFIREQQPVSVTLRTAGSQRVWMLGRLSKPGVYPLAGPTTLLEAIAEAGGLSARPAPSFAGMEAEGTAMAAPTGTSTRRSARSGAAGSMAMAGTSAASGTDEGADLSRAFIIRQGKVLRVDFTKLLREGDLSQNIFLQPDDFIYVPGGSSGTVHVLGAVFMPRAVDSRGQLTVARAVAQAGGTIRNAHLSQVAILRGSLTQPKVAIVDLNAIMHGQAPDIALEAQDIVYVPFTPYRVLTRYVDMILDTFARTIGVNEGARAVNRDAVPVGINVPVGAL